jgi:hypothetical protein
VLSSTSSSPINYRESYFQHPTLTKIIADRLPKGLQNSKENAKPTVNPFLSTSAVVSK